MKILTDYHHADLYESFGLVFADRFGWDLYRPIGMDWFDLGYWEFEKRVHGDAVARQYLSLWDGDRDCGTHWERDDATHPGRVHRMLTVEQARDLSPDVVIATVPHNEAGLHRFATETDATFGVQLGNVGQAFEVNWRHARFALCSTTLAFAPPVPYIVYRQEFSLSDFRYEWPPAEERSVASFVQCFPENRGPQRGGFYDHFVALSDASPDLDWKVYGAYGSAPTDHLACGNLPSTPAVAEAMRRTRVIWHAKFWSDGYGHVIHDAHAVGRPVMAHHDYYADKLAAPLMEHGVTGFDLSRMDDAEVLRTLRRLCDDDEYHREMSDNVAARFRAVVDFDADAAAIRELLERVA